ncbi:MAG: cyclic nucleotide-binding domain-containing protein [Acidimicrobiia bacterium]|nr:cyclic nucleotide-binding domain-containing protein [Acidimicrobiia bacterium]
MALRRRGELGKVYADGEVIIAEGETGDCMYVIQSGRVEVVTGADGVEYKVAELEGGDFFGEMALFDKEVRSATVRALGEARVLTVDKRTLLKRMSENPLLALNLLKTMSKRIRALDDRVSAQDGHRP